jgi:hypothetical protein
MEIFPPPAQANQTDRIKTRRDNNSSEKPFDNLLFNLIKNMAPSRMGTCAQADILVSRPNIMNVPPNKCTQQMNKARVILIFS